MNKKKIKFYIRLHWIKVLIIILVLVLGTTLSVLIFKGLKAWQNVGTYYRQSQLAGLPIQIFIWIVVGLIQTMVWMFMWYWLLFKKGHSSFTTVKKKAIAGEEMNIRWSDVIGMEEAKHEALEIVRLITDRAHLKRIGGQILRGLLMLGPPGCGKTYLAKAIATESGLPFISMSGSEFVEMFVGVGAGRIRSLFKQARQLAEMEGGCIVFIDEIDAVGAQRSTEKGFGGGQSEFNTTVNQLLVEMDGIKEKEVNVVVIAATNMPENFLDPALLRPGRFDRKIYVDLPDLEDRSKLFAYYLNKIKYDRNDLKLDRLSKISVGYSPADIANLVRESALITVRNRKESVSMQEIEEARERITLGIKRKMKMNEEEKKMTAYHEAGHALVTYLLVPTKDVFKATIIPRREIAGAVWTPEREETFIKDRNALLGEIKISLGGYTAEKNAFNKTTAGVDADFANALKTAHNMVWRWGMGKSGLMGNFSILAPQKQFGPSLISDETKAKLEADAQAIINDCFKEVEELLKKEKPLLDRFAQELFTKEELNYDEIEAIFKEFGKSRSNI